MAGKVRISTEEFGKRYTSLLRLRGTALRPSWTAIATAYYNAKRASKKTFEVDITTAVRDLQYLGIKLGDVIVGAKKYEPRWAIGKGRVRWSKIYSRREKRAGTHTG